MTVAAAGIGGDEDLACVGVARLADLLPPRLVRHDGERRRVVVDADAHEPVVGGQVVDEYLLTARDGKLYNTRGELFDTTTAESLHVGGGHAIFVMDANGNIYASTAHIFGEFHHSSLLAGQPVAGAGELVVEKGVVLEITRASGRYRPSEALANQVLTQLKKYGIQPKNVATGF